MNDAIVDGVRERDFSLVDSNSGNEAFLLQLDLAITMDLDDRLGPDFA